MPDFRPEDICVIIPTRDRWPILKRTLAALRQQSVSGFRVVVVVDGDDQDVPDLDGVQVEVKRFGGISAARNRGVASTSEPILLMFGDDSVPSERLIEMHLEGHRRHPEPETAILGRLEWHPELRRNRIARWMDWSSTQFDYRSIADQAGKDVGYGRFYGSAISLKRSLFESEGGYDEAFTHTYDDMELAYRLSKRGLRVIYEPAALANHLHFYTWADVKRRFESIALSERLITSKHPTFEPFFLNRMRQAQSAPPPSRLWPWIVEYVPQRWVGARRRAERLANRRYYSELAPDYLKNWDAAGEVVELREYLGDEYDHAKLIHHRAVVDEEAGGSMDEVDFYRTSNNYLYNLAVFAMSGTKDPYHQELLRWVEPGARLLDYGCGIGSDGLALIEQGYQVGFADFDNPSARYLRWRLDRRGMDATIYDIDRDQIPAGFDAAYSFDVIEHVPDPFEFLARLESLASVVAVNLLEPQVGETHLHHELPVNALVEHADKRGLLSHSIHYGRSHLVVYKGDPSPSRAAADSPAVANHTSPA